jgi:hypothetical protein
MQKPLQAPELITILVVERLQEVKKENAYNGISLICLSAMSGAIFH